MFPAAALAHVGLGNTHGFVHGFSHPLGGIDHILTMVAVGVFTALLGGRALWFVPLTFVVVMAIGGIMGTAGIDVPFVEIGIDLSVVVLGLVVAFQLSLPTVAAMALVGFFAIFHGHAHGAEMPETARGLPMVPGCVRDGVAACRRRRSQFSHWQTRGNVRSMRRSRRRRSNGIGRNRDSFRGDLKLEAVSRNFALPPS